MNRPCRARSWTDINRNFPCSVRINKVQRRLPFDSAHFRVFQPIPLRRKPRDIPQIIASRQFLDFRRLRTPPPRLVFRYLRPMIRRRIRKHPLRLHRAIPHHNSEQYSCGHCRSDRPSASFFSTDPPPHGPLNRRGIGQFAGHLFAQSKIKLRLSRHLPRAVPALRQMPMHPRELASLQLTRQVQRRDFQELSASHPMSF